MQIKLSDKPKINNSHVAFDIGNVLLEFKYQIFVDELVAQGIIKKNGGLDFIKSIQPHNDLGLLSIESALRDRLKFYNPKRIGWALDAWNKTLVLNSTIINFFNSIKKTHKVALLSNMGIDHSKFLAQNTELFSDCDLHLSFEVGSRKPQKLFFQSFLTEHPEYKNCLFVDDLKENLAMASRLGFVPFHFDLEENIKENLVEQSIQEIKRNIYV